MLASSPRPTTTPPALEPDALDAIRKVWKRALEARWRAPAPGRPPSDQGYISHVDDHALASLPHASEEGELPPATMDATARILVQAAERWESDEVLQAQGLIADGHAARGLWKLLRAYGAARGELTHERLRRLHEAFVHFRGAIAETFRADREHPAYELAARRLSGSAGRVVLFGHTHLAKDMALGPGRYLNTGTWCSTLALPASLYETQPGDTAALDELRAFVTDLCSNQLGQRLRLDTYCARLVIDGQDLASAGLCSVDDEGILTPCSVDDQGRLGPRAAGGKGSP